MFKMKNKIEDRIIGILREKGELETGGIMEQIFSTRGSCWSYDTVSKYLRRMSEKD